MAFLCMHALPSELQKNYKNEVCYFTLKLTENCCIYLYNKFQVVSKFTGMKTEETHLEMAILESDTHFSPFLKSCLDLSVEAL